MVKRCVVQNCTTGRDTEKHSVFRVPKNVDRRKLWQKNISVLLRDQDVVCDKHFESECVVREWVHRDRSGQIIAKVPYGHPRLTEDAVPTVFLNDGSMKRTAGDSRDEHMYACKIEEHSKGIEIDTASATTYSKPRIPVTISNQSDSTTINLAEHSTIESNELSEPENLMDVESARVTAVARQPESTVADNTFENISVLSTAVNEEITETGSTTSAAYRKYFSLIPKTWSVFELPAGKKLQFVFDHVITRIDNGVHVPITQKSVTLDGDKNLQYFVYGRRIDTQQTGCIQILTTGESLPDILVKFERMSICYGIGNVGQLSVPGDTAFRDYVQQWRDNGCSMICKTKRCEACMKLRKRVLQQASRAKNRKTLRRFRVSSNPADRVKLTAMRRKYLREKRRGDRAKKKVESLMTTVTKQQEDLSKMRMETLEEKCLECHVPEAQKLVLKEIVAAASKKDARGRRYTEEWMMLCMLLNIRSRTNYNLLRRNQILPLPSSRTIRRYLSLVGTSCGFDEQFALLLKKQFETMNLVQSKSLSKSSLQCHGLLMLDEINLRKSVAVCAKNLTYVGLTDFGDDGEQSTNIEDQATHGLVIMFQSLAGPYTQPIAVFASKNQVKGEELAKLIIKAICYIENCGAKIHAVVADGAATNVKMWSLLDVSGKMENTKTWFTHPLDSNRKVFAFSDPPHAVKNIRNRLLNVQTLRIKPSSNYIRWKYFADLFDLDKVYPGNARVCPKITQRHIQVDATSKMRVRLATQIFSNSVADGLKFYLSHKEEGVERLKGCEETIAFCKRVNDMFDALNCKSPNDGLKPGSRLFKELEDSLEWLNNWESAMVDKKIDPKDFLTAETSRALRMSLQSMIGLCCYLIDNYGFEYLLSGKVNQDNLEKFFGTVRQASGSNDHPSCPTFLQLYKLLSVYSILKPPKFGNCTTSKDSSPPILLSISDLRAASGQKDTTKYSEYLEKIRKRLDEVLEHDEWEESDVISYDFDHDYTLSPILDCIRYYVAGYLCKQVLKKYGSCVSCKEAVRSNSAGTSSVSQLVDVKSRGGLIHANLNFFRLIEHVESVFTKHCSQIDAFSLTVDEVLDNYKFSFPCKEHSSEILSYSIVYYLRLRMRQFAHQENLKMKKHFVVKNKLAKLTKQ